MCGVLQGSILEPLLFLSYTNDLPNFSIVFVPIMFADDTDLFFEHISINTLRSNEWFSANSLSLNVEKPSFHCFINQAKNTASPLLYQR